MAAVCRRCARAADRQLGREHHCTSTGAPGSGCPCQHRTDRYATTLHPAFRTTRKS